MMTTVSEETGAPASTANLTGPTSRTGWAMSLLAIAAVGFILRWATLDESFFGDEMFTYQIATKPTLAEALAFVRSDLEISPPLYFVASWFASHLGDAFLWPRIVSLLAGTATILLTGLLGARTVGRPAGLVGAALVALSPMAIFYSGEARAYSLMVMLVVLSTLSLLRALEGNRWSWWAAVSLLYAAAMYTHYTAAFVLAVQVVWALVAHRNRWRGLLISLATSALLFAWWLPALRADSQAPNQRIIGLAFPFSWDTISEHTIRLVLGGGFTSLSTMPGLLGASLVGIGLAVALIGWGWHRRRSGGSPTMNSGLALVVLMAVAAPLGAMTYSLVSDDLFLARNLQASLPAIYLLAGAAVTAAPRGVAWVSIALVLLGMGVSAGRTLDAVNQRPPAKAVASYLNDRVRPGDVVIESTAFSGPPATALAVHLDPSTTFAQISPRVPDTDATPSDGGRVFVVSSGPPSADFAERQLPAGYRAIDSVSWTGEYWGPMVTTFASG